jgi:hypothetical protein
MHEKFYGFNVEGMDIPSTYSFHSAVTVSANATELAEAILVETGERIPIATPGFKGKSSSAYIIPKGRVSSFVCPFPDEEVE